MWEDLPVESPLPGFTWLRSFIRHLTVPGIQGRCLVFGQARDQDRYPLADFFVMGMLKELLHPMLTNSTRPVVSRGPFQQPSVDHTRLLQGRDVDFEQLLAAPFFGEPLDAPQPCSPPGWGLRGLQ